MSPGIIVAIGTSAFGGFVLGETHQSAPQGRVFDFAPSLAACRAKATALHIPLSRVGEVGIKTVTTPAAGIRGQDFSGFVVAPGVTIPKGHVALGTVAACFDDAGLGDRAWAAK